MRRLVFVVLLAAGVALANAKPLPTDSVYRLDVPLTDQGSRKVSFSALAGSVRLVSMFYTGCRYACPTLVETIKRHEASLSASERAKLRITLVSLDPARDSVQVLHKMAVERGTDTARWMLARTPAVRKIAAVLNIQYRQLANKEFNHSSVLVLLSPEGRVLARADAMGGVDAELLEAIRTALGAQAGD